MGNIKTVSETLSWGARKEGQGLLSSDRMTKYLVLISTVVLCASLVFKHTLWQTVGTLFSFMSGNKRNKNVLLAYLPALRTVFEVLQWWVDGLIEIFPAPVSLCPSMTSLLLFSLVSSTFLWHISVAVHQQHNQSLLKKIEAVKWRCCRGGS